MLAYPQPIELQEAASLSTVRREIVLPVERDRAWELLTEPAELREWLADEVELEPEEGAPLRAVWWDSGAEREGVVEEVEERRRLRFRWDDGETGVPSRVEWTLDDAPGGTRVVVEERAARPARGRRDPLHWRPRRRRHHRRSPARPRWSASDRPAVDAVFAALADPTRRAVMGRLAEEPASASALAGELPVTRQAVAKHLAALDRAGLVAPRREGRELRYALDPAPMGDAMAWMASVGAQWDDRLAGLARRAAQG